MDNMQRNEIRQALKAKIHDVLQEELILIFNDYTIPETKAKRIINDICLWANLTIDQDLE